MTATLPNKSDIAETRQREAFHLHLGKGQLQAEDEDDEDGMLATRSNF